MPQFFRNDNRCLGFSQLEGTNPGIVFLGGFMSDMEGNKARYLECWAKQEGRAFLRFDYSGHGISAGNFADGTIGSWLADTKVIISALTKGPQIIVGSSMGGWLALLLARDRPGDMAGLVTIAAAPDFTEDSIWAGLTENQKAELAANGAVLLPSEYDDPYLVTSNLIEDGRTHLVFRSPLILPFPTRILHGGKDKDIGVSVAHRLAKHAGGDDVKLIVAGDANHRFSDPDCLELISRAIKDVIR